MFNYIIGDKMMLHTKGEYKDINSLDFEPQNGDLITLKTNGHSDTCVYYNGQWEVLANKSKSRFEHDIIEKSNRYHDVKGELLKCGFINTIKNTVDRFNESIESYSDLIDDLTYLYEVYEHEIFR